MPIAWFNEAWRATANQLFASALPFRRGLNAHMRYAILGSSPVRCCEIIRDGQIEWASCANCSPDAEIQWAMADASDLFARRLNGTEATARTTVVTTRRPGVRYRGLPPPMDLAMQTELAKMPIVREANLCLVCELTDAPFGDTYCTYSFDDGRFAALTLGVTKDPDAALTLPFRVLMQFFRGELSALETLQLSKVGGSQGSLALLCGLVESPIYRRAVAACAAGSAPIALATLGEIAVHDGYRSAMSSLVAETASPTGR